jgi:hypothetical protein
MDFVDGAPTRNFQRRREQDGSSKLAKPTSANECRVGSSREGALALREHASDMMRRLRAARMIANKVKGAPCCNLADAGPLVRLLARLRLTEGTGKLKHAVLLSFR